METLLKSLEDVPSTNSTDLDFEIFENDSSYTYTIECDELETDPDFFREVFTADRDRILRISEEKSRSSKYTAIQHVFIGNIIKSIMGQYIEELSGIFREKELNNRNAETHTHTVGIGDDIDDKENILPVYKSSSDVIDDLSNEFVKLGI